MNRALFLAVLLGLSSFAHSLPIHHSFKLDIAHELLESDFLNLTKAEREALIAELLLEKVGQVQDVYGVLSKLISQFSSQNVNEVIQSVVKGGSPKKSLSLIEIELEKVSFLKGEHSIKDLDTYVGSRIGFGTMSLSRDLDIRLIGGDAASAEAYLGSLVDQSSFSFFSIPSVYEEWGIKKVFVPKQGYMKKPLLLWIIPPDTRYVQHYAQLFRYANPNSIRAFLDTNAFKNSHRLNSLNGQKILSILKSQFIAVGYHDQWLSQISAHKDIAILNTKKIEGLDLGLNCTLVTYRIRGHTIVSSIALLSSEKTIWGRLTASHIRYLMHPKLKAVFFAGSAGSLDRDVKPYSVSIPERFAVNQVLPIRNLLNDSAIKSTQNKSAVERNYADLHGNSFSPIQQDLEFIKNAVSLGYSTIDVEQSLIAEEIQRYNSQEGGQVQFGAVNVVTDQPILSLLSPSEALGSALPTLDNVDRRKKGLARASAVEISLDSLIELSKSKKDRPSRCRSVLSL